MFYRFEISASLAVLAALAIAPAAYAQEAGTEAQSTSAAAEEEVDSGEILVTAQLRPETLQNTPASVTVATSEALEKAGVTSALALARAVPGLVVERGPAALSASVTLRGLGSSGGPGTFESSVAFFVNGVYLPRSREFSTSLFDVDRIEVVRGSQGSVLGKNTSLGAVSLMTRRPGRKLEGNASVTHEFNYNSWVLNGGISVPLSETLGLRVAGIYDDQGGWAENLVTGRRDGASNRKAGRATLVWNPTSSFESTLMYEHQDIRLKGLAAEIIQSNARVDELAALAGFPGLEMTLDRRTGNSDSRIPDGYLDVDNIDRASLTLSWNVGDHELRSQTAWSDTSGYTDAGTDYLPGDYFRFQLGTETSSLSQELRLISPSDRRFRYIAGIWLGKNTFDQIEEWDLDYPPLAATNYTTFTNQDTKSWSGFGQADLDILETLTLSAGLRYTSEKKAADFSRVVPVPGAFGSLFPPYAPFTLRRKENSLDGLVNLRYKVTDDLMVYAAWAQGTKSGGFASNVGALDQSGYRPEVAQTAELGMRYQSSDRSLTANATLFHTVVDDYQLTTFGGATFVVGNTDLRSVGIESQIIWRPTFAPGLRIEWSNTYAKAKDRITGGRIPNAPRWSGSANVDYDIALSNSLELNLHGGVRYESSQVRQQNPIFPPPSAAIELYDASIGVKSDAGYGLRLFGRNLTNANRTVFAFPTPFVGPPSHAGTPEHPRTISLELSIDF